MEIRDEDAERRIEESFYEERERMRQSVNLPRKSLNHSLLNTKKFMRQDSSQKESPKFSSLNGSCIGQEGVESKHALEPMQRVSLESAPNKQREAIQANSRWRSKEFSESGFEGIGIEFSPYRRPTSRYSRRAYLGKENIPQRRFFDVGDNLKQTDSCIGGEEHRSVLKSLQLQIKQLKARETVYKAEIQRLTNELATEKSAALSTKNSASNQIIELKERIQQLSQQNKRLREQSTQSKTQCQQPTAVMAKDECLRLQQLIQRELKSGGGGESARETLEQTLKKHRRICSFVESIADMKEKITGVRQDNIRELWRWLKKTIQEILVMNGFISNLKQTLKLSEATSLEELRTQLTKRLILN